MSGNGAGRSRRRGKGGSPGFTVLEFIVAFTLLTTVLSSLMAALGVGLLNDRQASFAARATLLAKAKLAAAGVAFPLRVGTAGGVEGPYEWRALVRPFDHPRGKDGLPVTALLVEVTVAEARSGGRTLTLSSLELVAAVRP